MAGHEFIDHEERTAVNEIFDQGGVLFAHGYHDKRKGIYRVREFEKEYASKFQTKYAAAVSTGTAALKVALKALGVGPGDEVITQAFTFVATVEAILDTGAKPVVVNTDRQLNINAAEIEKRISSKTKAIIPVHMHGFSADMDRILNISKKAGIGIVEDSCQAIGAKYSGKYLGTLGDLGTYSFDYNKTITTGEGGMVVTNSDKHGKFAKEYADHGHENNPALPRGRDTRTIWGFNYRLTELQAAVGRVQLRKLDSMLESSKKRYDAIYSELKNTAELRTPVENSVPVYDTVMFIVEDSVKRKRVIEHLFERGVGTKNVPDAVEWHFAGYWNHMLSKEQISELEPTRALMETYVSLPIAGKWSPSEYAKLGSEIRGILG